jgi:succinate dehydrogenase/fumarate reductase flavoprotein subunit
MTKKLLLLGLIVFFWNCSSAPDSGKTAYLRDVDIVIVGAGVAGSTAALAAAEINPNVKVVLVEASLGAGGSLARAGGQTTENLMRWGNPETTPGERAKIRETWENTGNIPAPSGKKSKYPYMPFLEAIALQAYPTFNGTLRKAGIAADHVETCVHDDLAYANGQPGYRSSSLFEEAVKNAKHIDFITQCIATDLYYIDGVVSGVIVRYEGKSQIIKAKKTILATGGFSRSAEYLATVDENLLPNAKSMANYAHSGAHAMANGNMIPVAQKAGAAIYSEWFCMGGNPMFHQTIYVGENTNAFQQSRYGTPPQLQMFEQIWVNGEGNRFLVEDRGICVNPTIFNNRNAGRAMYYFDINVGPVGPQALPPYPVIYNNNNLPLSETRYYQEPFTKVDWRRPQADGNNAGPRYGQPDTDVDLNKALSDAAASFPQFVKTGATIAELARNLYPGSLRFQENFINTVKAYNQAVENQSDPGLPWDRGKSTELLTKTFYDAVDTVKPGDPSHYDGPFYSVNVYPEGHHSFGGIAIDAKCRVLRQDFDFNTVALDAPEVEAAVIPNLYSVGELSSRAFYNTQYTAGSLLTFGPTTGRIAALDAAKAIFGN